MQPQELVGTTLHVPDRGAWRGLSKRQPPRSLPDEHGALKRLPQLPFLTCFPVGRPLKPGGKTGSEKTKAVLLNPTKGILLKGFSLVPRKDTRGRSHSQQGKRFYLMTLLRTAVCSCLSSWMTLVTWALRKHAVGGKCGPYRFFYTRV